MKFFQTILTQPSLQKCTTGVRTLYSQNPKSMHKSEYESVFFTCRKPATTNGTTINNIPTGKQLNGHTK